MNSGDVDMAGLVRQIAVIRARRSLELEIRLGRKVIEALFNGRIEPWLRRGRRDSRYSALAQHPELPITASELYRIVSTYVLSVRLPIISTLKSLAPSHLHAVLPLTAAHQERLLRLASSEGWSVRQLQHAANEARTRRAGPGRPKKARILKTLELLASLGADAFDDSEVLLALDSPQIERLRSTAENVLDQLQQVRSLLGRRSIHLTPAPWSPCASPCARSPTFSCSHVGGGASVTAPAPPLRRTAPNPHGR